MKINNIIWETDGYQVDLPKEVEVPNEIDEDGIADYLSDTYGFLVNSFSLPSDNNDFGHLPMM